MSQIRLSNVARYTGRFVAPSAVMTSDGNTLLLVQNSYTDSSGYNRNLSGSYLAKAVHSGSDANTVNVNNYADFIWLYSGDIRSIETSGSVTSTKFVGSDTLASIEQSGPPGNPTVFTLTTNTNLTWTAGDVLNVYFGTVAPGIDTLDLAVGITTWADSTSNHNDAAMNNGPLPTYGKYGTYGFDSALGQSWTAKGYVTLNGIDQYGFCGNIVPDGTDYTKMAVVRSSAWQDSNIISGYTIAFWAPGGTLKAGIGVHSYADITDGTLNLGEWYIVCETFSTSSGRRLYVNGVLVTSVPGATTGAGANEPAYIGAYNQTSVWNGDFAFAAIWNSTLGDQDVYAAYSSLRGRFGL
jgi:hypothetical protein